MVDEFEFWMENRMITFKKDGKSYTMARYYAPSRGPRPESYRFVKIKSQTTKSS